MPTIRSPKFKAVESVTGHATDAITANTTATAPTLVKPKRISPHDPAGYARLNVIDELISNREAYCIDSQGKSTINVGSFPNFMRVCINKVNATVALRLAKSNQTITRSGDKLVVTMEDGSSYRVAKPRGRRGDFLTCEPGSQAVARACITAGMGALDNSDNVNTLVKYSQDFYLTNNVSSLFQNEVDMILSNWGMGIPDPKMSGVGRYNIWVDSDMSIAVTKMASRLGLKINVLVCLCMAYALEGQVELGDYCKDLKLVTQVFDTKIKLRLGMAGLLQKFMDQGKRRKRAVVSKRVSRRRR